MSNDEDTGPLEERRAFHLTDVERDVLARRAAELFAAGATHDSVSKELKIHKVTLRAVIKSTNFDKYLADTFDEIAKPARGYAKRALSRLMPKAIKAVEDALDSGDLEAAKIVFKSAGIEAPQEDGGKDTTIVVNLPNLTGVTTKQETIIEIPREDTNE